jgi:hypothetical protein
MEWAINGLGRLEASSSADEAVKSARGGSTREVAQARVSIAEIENNDKSLGDVIAARKRKQMAF